MSAAAIAEMSDRWAASLIEFNLLVARFAHQSWFPHEPAHTDAWRGLAGGLAEDRLSDWLLEELDLRGQMDWEMEAPQKRLWLLGSRDLARLSYDLSLAMHRDWIARVIDGPRLRALHARVDHQAWRFVVEGTPAEGIRHRAPVVDFERTSEAAISELLQRDGAATLMSLLDPAWRAVCQRARLYFDRLAVFDAMPLPTPRREQVLDLICAHLIPQRLPQWAWLF